MKLVTNLKATKKGKCYVAFTGFVLVVHGFERPEHEEMKQHAASRSVFTFLRAELFQIRAPLASIW